MKHQHLGNTLSKSKVCENSGCVFLSKHGDFRWPFRPLKFLLLGTFAAWKATWCCIPSFTGWQLKDFLFSPQTLGKWSNLTKIFQMGWNHQLDYVQVPSFDCCFCSSKPRVFFHTRWSLGFDCMWFICIYNICFFEESLSSHFLCNWLVEFLFWFEGILVGHEWAKVWCVFAHCFPKSLLG